MNVSATFVRDRRTGLRKRIKMWFLLVAVIQVTVGCARPTPPAGWETSFDTAEGWNLSSDPVADVSVMQGALNVHVMAPGQIAWAASEAEWQDCQVSVEATQVAGPADNEYGVLIRMAQDGSFTAFSISGDGYSRVALYQDGSWSVIGPDWAPTPAINEGAATNQLEIVADGTQLAFRVNGELVRQVEAGEARAGAIGLYAGAFSEGGVVVAFDNLVVEPLP
jgi:hypothetical protein